MEKLAYMLVVVFLAALASAAGCAWLLHTAINEGNFWKGLVAVIIGLPAVIAAYVSGGIFRG